LSSSSNLIYILMNWSSCSLNLIKHFHDELRLVSKRHGSVIKGPTFLTTSWPQAFRVAEIFHAVAVSSSVKRRSATRCNFTRFPCPSSTSLRKAYGSLIS
jgi:hypothetical protein